MLQDQSLYEILEVQPAATPQEIERAYRICRATYEPNSVATYSVFSDEENNEILKRIEDAYAILCDARRRREYDARMDGEEPAQTTSPEPFSPPPRPIRPRLSIRRTFEVEEPFESGDGTFDGESLRRYRLSRGVELEEISTVTKINEETLERLESNRYCELPAPVYIRGFLKEYARCLSLDPTEVADGYMRKLHETAGGI